MTEVVVAQRMWQRRGTTAEWAAANTILAAGEIGVELLGAGVVPKIKVGDGVTPWNTLGYAGGGGSGDPIELQTNATHIQWRVVGEPTWTNLIALSEITGADGADGATGPAGPVGPPGPASSAIFGATFDGGGGDIEVGATCDVFVSYGCTITKATILAAQVGSLEVDVWVDSYANFPPTDADSITGASPPSLGGTNKYQDSTLTGWDTSVASGAVVRFCVVACTGVERATIVIEGIRT